MDIVFVVLMFAGGGWGAWWVVAGREAQQKQLADTVERGRLLHQRTGDYPAACTWCKSTTLARKLLVFRQAVDQWEPVDVVAQLRQCPDASVPVLAATLSRDQPSWRRFCSERCTNEFLRGEHAVAAVAFGSCEYCSTRFPMAVVRCPNCNAARRS
jgi:hypothetical protein